jgi:hypothetical protein
MSGKIGLGHLETLVENLKRDLAMGGATLSGLNLPTIAAPTSATTTLTADDSGKVVLLAANAAIVVLPTPVVGQNFKVVLAADYATAASKIRTATTDGSVHFVGHSISAASDDGNVSDNDSNDIISFGSATLVGDTVDLVCISSTQWLAVGTAQTGHNSNSIVFSDS